MFADEVETWTGYEEYVPKLRKLNEEVLFKHDAEEKLEDKYLVRLTL